MDAFDHDKQPTEARPDRSGRVKKTGVMVSPKMRANSLSLAIFSQRVTDPNFQHPCDFVEVEVSGEFIAAAPLPTAPETPMQAEYRTNLAAMYVSLYESIAESLGPTTPDLYRRFCAVCDSEGIPRLPVAGFRI